MTVGIWNTNLRSRMQSLVPEFKINSLDKTKLNFFILLYFKGVYEMLNLSKYFLIQFAYLFI